MRIPDFEELRVYQSAYGAAMEIFEQSKSWPQEEQYALTDQIRRSSRAVCSNIAEAWSKRRYERHFISKLSDAEVEASETLTWLRFAVDCGYLSGNAHNDLHTTYRKIRGGSHKNNGRPREMVRTSPSRPRSGDLLRCHVAARIPSSIHPLLHSDK